MDMQLSEDQKAIDENVRQLCREFDDQYWTDCEENSRFPMEYYTLMASAGWLGSIPCQRFEASALPARENHRQHVPKHGEPLRSGGNILH